MELIAKVTGECNMHCKYCSASNIKEGLTVDEVVEAAKQCEARELILLGGEPLLLPPSYYKEILDRTECHISITTNLTKFMDNPIAWGELFRDPRVGVTTSFNYGDTRIMENGKPLNAKDFIYMMKMFKLVVGYMPEFISVIDKKNAPRWKEHINLARRLGTRVRLNNALKLGRSQEYYPRCNMFKIWTTCVSEHLDEYEINSSNRGNGKCPLATNGYCSSTIRVVVKRQGKLHYYNCDDSSALMVDELPCLEDTKPVCSFDYIKPMFEKCRYCKLYRLCNACKNHLLMIEDKDYYCKTMKSLEDKFIKQGWLL